MNDYVYRVDTVSGFNKIKDKVFRARRWTYPGSYPHKLLQSLYADLPETDGLYRICFYSSQEIADKSLIGDFLPQGESRMYRCPKEAILSCGFSESWDNGFNEGVAYLFWRQENLNENNTQFSLSGISLEYFDVLTEGEWMPLVEFLNKTSSIANETVGVAKDIINKPPVPGRRSWWKFWL
ncbi:hypothetical protein [Citrobacter sp. Cy230]|uniref:hypothetical protein n=1 Tax=Citrobacter sp. Cy230 TaxID=2985163 RepID=UPI0025775D19|nr:hypothetical protein [Citrobacter sp. Cy230]MDM2724211.1 hypothetical protein [Citrobacter sp. Cy230]